MVEFFDRNVGEAIKSVQERNRCLLVTVQDDSDVCKDMGVSLWTDSSIVEAISEAEFTCLMIRADTQDYLNFKSIFPVYVFPTVYILAPNGKPLAYFAASVPNSELVVKVQQSALKLQEEYSSSTGQNRTSDGNAGPPGVPNPVSREWESNPRETTTFTHTEDPVPSAATEPTAESSKRPVSAQNASAELIRTEEKDAIWKETEETTAEYHISSAAAPAPSESTGEDDQGSSAEELAPEQSEGISVSAPTATAVGAQEETPRPPEKEMTSLCFRLPDSSKLVQNFKRTDSLAQVERFVRDNVGMMKMQCLYPHMSFQSVDFEKSLEDLGLHPSATILLVEERSAVRAALSPTHRVRSARYALSDMIRRVGDFFKIIFARIQAFFAGIMNTAQLTVDQRSASSPAPTTSQQRSAPARTDNAGFGPSRLATLGDYGQSPSQSQQQGGGLFRRPGANPGDQGSAGIRRSSNVATFSSPSSDNDEKKTNFWNGNSTQFGGDDNKRN